MTTVFRWYSIGPDRYVVTGGGSGVLVGYAGKDARAQAKAKAEALATWSRWLGHDAIVLGRWETHAAVANEPAEGLDRIRPARGFTWSTLGLKRPA